MSVSDIISEITTNVPALNTVTEALQSHSHASIDTSAQLTTLLDATFANQTFPLTLQDKVTTFPNAVYFLVTSTPVVDESYHLAWVDKYIVQVRAKTFDELITKLDALRTGLEASVYGVEISDLMSDYDDEMDSYRINLEITFTTPATASTPIVLPAASVYEAAMVADPPLVSSRCVRQRIVTRYSVVIQTIGADMITLRNAVHQALLGYTASTNHEPMWLNEGAPLGSDGGLVMWRSMFSEAELIFPTIHT